MSDNRNIDIQLNLKADDYLAKISQSESVTRNFFNRCYQDADRMTAKMFNVANSLKTISNSKLNIDKDRNIERKTESITRLNNQLNNLKSTELKIKTSGDVQLKSLQNELQKITRDLTSAQTKANEFISALGWKNKPLDLTNTRDLNRLQKNILGKSSFTTELPQLMAERNKLKSWLGDYQYGLDKLTEGQLAGRFGANHFDKYQDTVVRIGELNKLISPLQEQQKVFTDARNIALSYQQQQRRISDSELKINDKLNANLIAQNKVKDNILSAEKDLVALKENKLSKLNNQSLKTEEKFNDLVERRKKLWEKGYEAEQEYYAKQNKQNYIDNTGLKEQIGLWGQVERVTGIISSSMRSIGQLVISAGQGLNMFSRFYGGGILNNPVGQLANMAANKFTSGISGGQTRYDILKTYPEYMKILGVETEKSNQLLDKMWKNVEGTSIKYDEMVNRAKQYSMILGDVDRGTNLAISTERAFLFGGMGNEGIRAKSSLDYLISTGEVNRFTQWRSIVTGLGAAGQILAKKLGYANTRELLKDMRSETNGIPKVSGEMFLNALESLNDTDEMNEMARIYMSTLESVKNTLNNAFNVGWGNIFTSLDNVLAKKGTSLHSELEDILLGTKGMFQQLTDWIDKNPDVVFKTLDKIKNYDWKGLIVNVGGNVKKFFEIIIGIFTKIPPSWSAFGMTLASPLASILQGFGLVTSFGGRGVKQFGNIARFIKTGKQKKLSALTALPIENFNGSVVNDVDDLTQTTTKLGGLKTKLSSGVGLAAGLIGVIGEATLVMWGIGKALESISNMKFGKNLGRNMGIIAITGGMLIGIVGTLTGIFTALSSSGVGALAIAVGELATLGIVGIVALAVKTMKDMAEATEIISNLKISKNITSNLDTVSTVLSELSKTMVKIATDNYIGFWDSIKYKNLSKTFLNMGEALQSIIDVSTNLDKIMDNPHLSNIYAKRAVKEQLVETIRLYGDILKAIEPYLTVQEHGMNNRYQKITNIRSLPLGAMLQTLTDVSDIFVQMQSAITNLKGIDTSTDDLKITDFETAITKISDCIDILNEKLVLSGKWASLDMTNNESLKNINVMIAVLSGISSNINTMSNHTYNLENLFTTLDGILNDINKIDDEKLGAAKGKVNDLAKSVNDLQSILNNFTWQPFIDNLLGSTLLSTLDLVRSKIISLQKDILLLNGKNSNKVSADFVGPLQSDFVERAEGGIIGKVANGARSIFSRGSDTIHTLLTPGEYVIRKQVAQTLGYDVLDKLNSMDLMGAFSSMGFTPRLNYAKNSNNSYNNNASVVQNIYNAPQNYTQKRAGRFVKGLLR